MTITALGMDTTSASMAVTTSASTLSSTIAPTVASTTQVANQCFNSFQSPCASMVFRYNQLAQQSVSSGIVFAVTAFALCVFAVSQTVVALFNGCTMKSERIRWVGVGVSLMLAAGFGVGAGMTINYDNQSILNACLKS